MTNTSKSNKATPAKKPAVKKNMSLIGIKQAFKSSAESMIDLAKHHNQERKKANPDLKDDASRRDQLGENGMAAECHAKSAAILAAMPEAAVKMFKEETNFTITHMTKPAQRNGTGGLAGYAKAYTCTMLRCATEKVRPNALDMSAVNAEIQKLDKTYKGGKKRCGDSVINHLIDALKEKTHDGKCEFTLNYWSAERNGLTQGRYIFNILHIGGMGKKSGSKEATMMKIDINHPVIKALMEIK